MRVSGAVHRECTCCTYRARDELSVDQVRIRASEFSLRLPPLVLERVAGGRGGRRRRRRRGRGRQAAQLGSCLLLHTCTSTVQLVVDTDISTLITPHQRSDITSIDRADWRIFHIITSLESIWEHTVPNNSVILESIISCPAPSWLAFA